MSKLNEAKLLASSLEDSREKDSLCYCLEILEELLGRGCTASTCGMRWGQTRKEFFELREDPSQ